MVQIYLLLNLFNFFLLPHLISLNSVHGALIFIMGLYVRLLVRLVNLRPERALSYLCLFCGLMK